MYCVVLYYNSVVVLMSICIVPSRVWPIVKNAVLLPSPNVNEIDTT